MKHTGARLLLFVFCLSAAAARADTYLLGTPGVDADGSTLHEGWQGSVAAGYLATSGNSNTRSYNAKAMASYLTGRWQHMFMAQALGASDSGVTTASSHEFNAQSDYNLDQASYLFGYLDALHDSFSGYDRRLTELAGYGYRVLNSDTQQLTLEAGAGARQTRYVDGTSQSAPVERLALNYLWKFSDKNSFSEQLSTEHGIDNTYTQSVTALTANLVGSFALSLSYTVKHNSQPFPGFKPTDTSTAVSLVYTF